MANYLFFAIILLNGFCLLARKNSKIIALLSVGAMSILMAYANTSNVDTDLYRYRLYYNAGSNLEDMEMGYQSLARFFYDMDYDFEQFRLMLFIISAVLIFLFVRKYTKNYNIVVLLYTLELLYFQSIALRYFISTSIVVFACLFLFKEKKINLVWYGLLVLFATWYHTSAYIFLLYIPFCLFKKSNKLEGVLNITALIGVGVTLMCMVMPSIINRLSTVMFSVVKVLNTDMMEMGEQYLLSSNYARSYVFVCFAYIFTFILTKMATNHLKQDPKYKVFCYRLNILGLVHMTILPLCLANVSIIRILFIYLTVSMAVCSKVITDIKPNEPAQLSLLSFRFNVRDYKIFVLLSAVFWCYVVYMRGLLGFDIFTFLSDNMF